MKGKMPKKMHKMPGQPMPMNDSEMTRMMKADSPAYKPPKAKPKKKGKK
mgnify:CR=1 FL=1